MHGAHKRHYIRFEQALCGYFGPRRRLMTRYKLCVRGVVAHWLPKCRRRASLDQIDCRFQVRMGQMSIAHGDFEIRVPQELLDRLHRCPGGRQMRGERVTKLMRRDPANSGSVAGVTKLPIEAIRAEAPTVLIDKDEWTAALFPYQHIAYFRD